MTERGSKQMIITADTETGKVVSVTDENGNQATKLDCRDLDKIYEGKDGFKYVGTILYAHESPGCFYVILGGWPFKICL